MKSRKERFPGLELPPDDRKALMKELRGRARLSVRRWRRIRMLQLLDAGWNLANAAKAVGTFPREARRVGTRYLERGLVAALTDDPRPNRQPKMLDAKQQSAIVAMVCTPPPEGLARWTIAVIAEEAVKRKLVPRVGRETVRVLLATHALKPWREKNVVRPRTRRRVRRADGGRPRPSREAEESPRAGGGAG